MKYLMPTVVILFMALITAYSIVTGQLRPMVVFVVMAITILCLCLLLSWKLDSLLAFLSCMLAPSARGMRVLRRKVVVIPALIATAMLVAFAVWWNLDRERRWEWLRNDYAHCTGCSSILRWRMYDYARDHDGWFPKGGTTPLNSLIALVEEEYLYTVGFLTSHALTKGLYDHYEKYNEISPEYCCYRYNEGLREEDPGDLIVLYYYKPTRWYSSTHKQKFEGRQVLAISDWIWQFIPEDEFQRRQAQTQQYLEERKERAHEIEQVKDVLRFVVTKTILAQNEYRFGLQIQNVSKDLR